jgi:hypothetical protein
MRDRHESTKRRPPLNPPLQGGRFFPTLRQVFPYPSPGFSPPFARFFLTLRKELKMGHPIPSTHSPRANTYDHTAGAH